MSQPTEPRVASGVGAITIVDDRILLVKRFGKHGSGTYSVPGGWQEVDEHPYQTAERETLEETGITVKAASSWGPGWTSGLFLENGTYGMTLWVACEYISGEPTITEPDKCTEVAWVPLSALASMPLFAPLAEVQHLLVT